MRPFYVTTPIYYVNDRPHIGHAYSTIAADAMARYAKLRGRPTRFLTGLDEHGQKIERVAKDQGLSPKAYVDRMVPPFRNAWEALSCTPDDFIRTTEPRHEARVVELWKRCVAAGDIYLGAYEGWYCVADEAFYTEKELVDGKSPTGRPVERVREPSYFFRLSNYTDKLLAFYEQHPEFVKPEGRFNEVKSFVKQGLQDLSISRTTFRWGVPVPNDPEHVMYVWFDALTNYLSALGGPSDQPTPLSKTFWEEAEVIHLVGKDILRFHAIFWPAFLMSAGIKPPTQIFAHGWLTVNGEKMSKSSGNFIPPEPIADAVGADVLRYFLLRELALGQDGDFNHEKLLARYHGDLGNGLGNLLNRVVTGILPKAFDGRIPAIASADLQEIDREVIAVAARAAENAAKHLDLLQPNRALEAMWELVTHTNKYVDQTAPWALAKNGDLKRLGVVSYIVLESLRWLSVMLWPVLPNKCDALRAQLGLGPLLPVEGLDFWPSAWGGLVSGTSTRPATALFPRFDDIQQAAMLERLGVKVVATPEAKKKPVSSDKPKKEPAVGEEKTDNNKTGKDKTGKDVIDAQDFFRVDLRVGLVLQADRVPKSDRLLRLQVDLGDPAPRQVLAGIAKHYAPEALVGKKLAFVANLPPRPMMGLESHGMVLAAKSVVDGEERLSPLFLDKDLPPGSGIA